MTLTETIVDLSILQTIYANELSPVTTSQNKKRGKNVSFSKQLERVRYFRAEEPAVNVNVNVVRGTQYEQPVKEQTPYHAIRSSACKIRSMHDIATKVQADGVTIDTLVLRYPFLEGHIFVKNISFHKRVVIKYTSDDWRTFTELDAKYVSSDQVHQMDRFSFYLEATGYFQTSSMARSDVEKHIFFLYKI